MRIATAQYQAIMSRSLETNQAKMLQLNAQMTSGNRIQVPSDDPIGAVRLSRLNREESTIDQYRNNIASLQTRLTKNETYLTSMVNDMQEGRDLMVGALDGTNTPADLNARVNSLISLRDSLVFTANTTDAEGNYLFSGTVTNSAAITYDDTAAVGARYSFSGNQDSQQVIVSNGITQPANANVAGLEDLLNRMDEAIEALKASDVSASDPATRATLTNTLNAMDLALNDTSSTIADIGGAQNILTTLDDNHSNVSLSNQTALFNIGSTDYAATATDLSAYETALQASYAAYSKISKLSLFDVI